MIMILVWHTFRIVSDTLVNPLPLIVISRNFSGNCPAISLRKSVADTVLKATFESLTVFTFCGSGELIHSFCRFSRFPTIFGILKSGKFE